VFIIALFDRDHWFTRLLHNQAAMALQRRVHLRLRAFALARNVTAECNRVLVRALQRRDWNRIWHYGALS
jgi:hypothetical protein